MISLSLITVVFNDFVGLRKTINSIDNAINRSGNKMQFEHVIIDGGSTDGSIYYLQELTNHRDVVTRVVSESDDGIYDAMNKGVRHASGDGVLFLNAGDEIYPGFNIDELLQDLSDSVKNPEEAGIAYSAIMRVGRKDFLIKSREIDTEMPRMPSIHQSMLYKRSVLISLPFNICFKICGDYDNFARILGCSLRFRPINRIFAIFYTGGASSQSPFQLIQESFFISTTRFHLTFFNKIFIFYKLVLSVFFVQMIILRFKFFGGRH